MYPFQLIVVGCGENTLLDLNPRLANEAIQVEAELPDIAAVLRQVPFSQSEKRLFVVEVHSTADLTTVMGLSNAYAAGHSGPSKWQR